MRQRARARAREREIGRERGGEGKEKCIFAVFCHLFEICTHKLLERPSRIFARARALTSHAKMCILVACFVACFVSFACDFVRLFSLIFVFVWIQGNVLHFWHFSTCTLRCPRPTGWLFCPIILPNNCPQKNLVCFGKITHCVLKSYQCKREPKSNSSHFQSATREQVNLRSRQSTSECKENRGLSQLFGPGQTPETLGLEFLICEA